MDPLKNLDEMLEAISAMEVGASAAPKTSTWSEFVLHRSPDGWSHFLSSNIRDLIPEFTEPETKSSSHQRGERNPSMTAARLQLRFQDIPKTSQVKQPAVSVDNLAECANEDHDWFAPFGAALTSAVDTLQSIDRELSKTKAIGGGQSKAPQIDRSIDGQLLSLAAMDLHQTAEEWGRKSLEVDQGFYESIGATDEFLESNLMEGTEVGSPAFVSSTVRRYLAGERRSRHNETQSKLHQNASRLQEILAKHADEKMTLSHEAEQAKHVKLADELRKRQISNQNIADGMKTILIAVEKVSGIPTVTLLESRMWREVIYAGAKCDNWDDFVRSLNTFRMNLKNEAAESHNEEQGDGESSMQKMSQAEDNDVPSKGKKKRKKKKRKKKVLSQGQETTAKADDSDSSHTLSARQVHRELGSASESPFGDCPSDTMPTLSAREDVGVDVTNGSMLPETGATSMSPQGTRVLTDEELARELDAKWNKETIPIAVEDDTKWNVVSNQGDRAKRRGPWIKPQGQTSSPKPARTVQSGSKGQSRQTRYPQGRRNTKNTDPPAASFASSGTHSTGMGKSPTSAGVASAGSSVQQTTRQLSQEHQEKTDASSSTGGQRPAATPSMPTALSSKSSKTVEAIESFRTTSDLPAVRVSGKTGHDSHQSSTRTPGRVAGRRSEKKSTDVGTESSHRASSQVPRYEILQRPKPIEERNAQSTSSLGNTGETLSVPTERAAQVPGDTQTTGSLSNITVTTGDEAPGYIDYLEDREHEATARLESEADLFGIPKKSSSAWDQSGPPEQQPKAPRLMFGAIETDHPFHR